MEHNTDINIASLCGGKGEIDFSSPSSMTEEFRSIKRALLSQQAESFGNRIMVTSASRQEGKSFISANLASSIALEKGKHVLLVDTNVQNSKLSKLLSPEPKQGLIDYLDGSLTDITKCILKTEKERLSVMPFGNSHYLSNELLSSPEMETLMNEFQSRYDDRIVIFDAPPIIGVNETLAIAKHVDHIVVVVSEDFTKVGDLKLAQSLLPKDKKIHFILNKTMDVKAWNTPDEISENDKVLTGTLN